MEEKIVKTVEIEPAELAKGSELMLSLTEDEVMVADTLEELTNGKGDDEDE